MTCLVVDELALLQCWLQEQPLPWNVKYFSEDGADAEWLPERPEQYLHRDPIPAGPVYSHEHQAEKQTGNDY